MSLYDKMQSAMDGNDFDAVAELYHQDYTFVRHQSGVCVPRSQWLPMMKSMFESDKFEMHSNRCLYENDEILAMHSIISFPDGTSEAVLAVHRLKDGMIHTTETGATPI